MSDVTLNHESVPGTSVGSTAPADTAEASPGKPRSGFQRQKLKIARLTDLYANLLTDHEDLLLEHGRLQDSHDQLRADYGQLEAAYAEVLQLNAALAGELRQAKQQPLGRHRPPPGFNNLMGMMTRG